MTTASGAPVSAKQRHGRMGPNSFLNQGLRRIGLGKKILARRTLLAATPCFLLVFLFVSFAPLLQAAQVGLFMGSFDPPHFGILRMIEEARSRFSLDAIYVVPTPSPVDRLELAPLNHRLAMLRLLTKNVPEVRIPGEEELLAILARDPANLFAAMREEIMSKRAPEDEIFQIIGEDALSKLIARNQLPVPGERRRVVVFPRHGIPETRNPLLAEQIRDGRVIRIDADIPDLASRDLRSQMLERCEPSTDALPEAIRTYIKREGLFGMPTTPLSGRILEGFAPVGYFAKPVLLYEVKTAPDFLSASPEPLTSTSHVEAANPASDFPPTLAPVLANHQMHVTTTVRFKTRINATVSEMEGLNPEVQGPKTVIES